jgi:hypothetical protein
MLQAHPEIDTGATLIVNFNQFGASSLDFFIYTFTRTVEWVHYHEVKQDVLLKIAAIIRARGAEIAFPTRTLHSNRPPAGCRRPPARRPLVWASSGPGQIEPFVGNFRPAACTPLQPAPPWPAPHALPRRGMPPILARRIGLLVSLLLPLAGLVGFPHWHPCRAPHARLPKPQLRSFAHPRRRTLSSRHRLTIEESNVWQKKNL